MDLNFMNGKAAFFEERFIISNLICATFLSAALVLIGCGSQNEKSDSSSDVVAPIEQAESPTSENQPKDGNLNWTSGSSSPSGESSNGGLDSQSLVPGEARVGTTILPEVSSWYLTPEQSKTSVAVVISGQAKYSPVDMEGKMFVKTARVAADGFKLLGYSQIIQVKRPSFDELEKAFREAGELVGDSGVVAVYFIAKGRAKNGNAELLISREFKWKKEIGDKTYFFVKDENWVSGNQLDLLLHKYFGDQHRQLLVFQMPQGGGALVQSLRRAGRSIVASSNFGLTSDSYPESAFIDLRFAPTSQMSWSGEAKLFKGTNLFTSAFFAGLTCKGPSCDEKFDVNLDGIVSLQEIVQNIETNLVGDFYRKKATYDFYFREFEEVPDAKWIKAERLSVDPIVVEDR